MPHIKLIVRTNSAPVFVSSLAASSKYITIILFSTCSNTETGLLWMEMWIQIAEKAVSGLKCLKFQTLSHCLSGIFI